MNKKILLFSATLGIAYLGFTSYSAGPSSFANLTGSAGSTASCGGSGCHASGSASTTGTVALRVKSTGGLVTNGKYVPGTLYQVTLGGTNTSLLPKYGFQISVTKTDNTNAGTLTATAANTAKKTAKASTIQVIEHTAPLAIGSPTPVYTVTFDWTAPASGTGRVTFYGIINAVNGTGNASGDMPSTGFTQAFDEQGASINEKINNIASKVYPNPCNNVLNIEAASSTKFMATVYDVAGRQVIAPSHQSSIDVSSLTNGLYMLRLNTEEGQQTVSFIKQ